MNILRAKQLSVFYTLVIRLQKRRVSNKYVITFRAFLFYIYIYTVIFEIKLYLLHIIKIPVPISVTTSRKRFENIYQLNIRVRRVKH